MHFDSAMLVVQAGDLMAAVGDLGNQFWHLISHPAVDEECRFRVVLVEQFARLSVSFDTDFGGTTAPVR